MLCSFNKFCNWTCIGFPSVHLIINIHGKFFKLMVAQLQEIKMKNKGVSVQCKVRKSQRNKSHITIAHRLQLLLCSLCKIWQIQTALDKNKFQYFTFSNDKVQERDVKINKCTYLFLIHPMKHKGKQDCNECLLYFTLKVRFNWFVDVRILQLIVLWFDGNLKTSVFGSKSQIHTKNVRTQLLPVCHLRSDEVLPISVIWNA